MCGTLSKEALYCWINVQCPATLFVHGHPDAFVSETHNDIVELSWTECVCVCFLLRRPVDVCLFVSLSVTFWFAVFCFYL